MDDIPPNWSGGDLEELFAAFGEVESAVMHGTGVSGMVAFEEAAGAKAAVALARRGGALAYCPRWAREEGAGDEAIGLRRLVTQHLASTAPDARALEAAVNEWFEENEERKERAAAEKRAMMEGDGWTVVTSTKGRKRNRDEEGTTAVGAVTQGRAQGTAQRKKKLAVGDFYRFQKREQHRSELLSLREKFERDKQSALARKSERKFLLNRPMD